MLGYYYRLPAEFDDLIAAELEQGEEILWQDQPILRFFSSYFFTTHLAGVMVYLLVAPIIFCIILSRIPAEFLRLDLILALTTFLLFGLVAGSCLPLLLYSRQKKTVYLLTNRRAMEIVARRKPLIRSWPLESITQIRLAEKTPSIGNLEIVQGVRIIGDDPCEQKGFLHIKRAGEVARQLNILTDGRAEIVAQEETKPLSPAATGSPSVRQQLAKEDSSKERKNFLLQLLSPLFRLVLFFLLAVVLFGTPVAMAWGTNTGGAGFCFFLLLFTIYGLINPMRRQTESGQWPATEGVVEESWIARVHAEDTPSYRPHVRYRYRVGDKVYRNGSIDIPGCDWEEMSKTAAERKVALYPEGIRVIVYHDPKHPSFSVLEAGKVHHSYWLPVIILLPFLVWSGYHIYTTWPGFDPYRFRILWEHVRGYLEIRRNVGS